MLVKDYFIFFCYFIQYCSIILFCRQMQYVLWNRSHYKFLQMEKKNSGSEYPGKFRDIETRGIKMKRKPMFDDTHTTLLNGIQLGFEKGFGFHQNKDIKSNAYCIDDNRIIYILASQIVLYDLLAETQKIIASFDYEEQIGAMIYFKNIMLEDNIVYAIHSANKSFPTLVMQNFTKNISHKFMLANLEKEEKIIDLVLFNDFRNIALISSFDQIVRLTILESATKEIKLSEFLNFSPLGILSLTQFPSKILAYSLNQIYTIETDGELKISPLSAKKQLDSQQNIVDIAASLNLELSLYCITNKGHLYFLALDLKQNKLSKVQKVFLGTFITLNEQGHEIEIPRKPSSICANEYNILIGYELLEEFTLVKIYAVSTQIPTLEPIRFSCPFLHKITRMNFAAETMAVCVIVQVKENDKYDLSIPIHSNFFKERSQEKIIRQNIQNHSGKPGKIFPIIFNLLLYDTLVETLRSPVQTLLSPMLLTKKIIEICVLPTKRLILILSADKRIKAVKYENISSISFQKMLAWEMIFNQSDQITSLDVHPLIFTVAVGFKEGIKLFSMFSNGIKPTNIQFPLKNCECVKYSKFGHLLIAGSSNQILLINPYEHKIVNNIQLGYSFNIKQLSFIDQDMYLYACFTNGNSQIMGLEGNKIFQVWNKNSKCITSCYDPVFDIMVMSYEDNEVKFYREKGQMQFAIMWTFPFVITKILIVNELGTAFMGTSTGKIRAYQWPFTDMVKFSKSFTEIQLHRSSINQIKIGHDFSYLISGSEEGSVFISKIFAYSDGILVSDSSVLHTFKVNKKNYTSLYYLQNLTCTNSSRQSQKQQEIIQYELDKVDFETDENFILNNLKQQIDEKLNQEQKNRKQNFKAEIGPYEKQIQSLNTKKLEVKEELNKLFKEEEKEIEEEQEKKLNQMRKLYKQSDHLKIKLAFYKNQYEEETKLQKQKYENEHSREFQNLKSMQGNLMKECQEIEKDLEESKLNYIQLMKEEEQEGKIYKKKMMEALEEQLLDTKQKGEELRKIMNKINHDIHTMEDKSKFFSHQITQLLLDIQNNRKKQDSLKNQVEYLSKILKEKDQQIFDEEKAVKQLLKKSINNYTHEEYLKHKQDELIAKAKYLQKQIENLDDKYNNFQQNFIDASKESNENIEKIQASYNKISCLKKQLSLMRQKKFMRNYKFKEIYSSITNQFHACNSKKVFNENVIKIISQDIDGTNSKSGESDGFNPFSQESESEKVKPNIDKRDHLIDQVINNNKLRKIDDTIRRTIMIKLNRETVNLTSQVNQLRKQKKKLSILSRDLHKSIKMLEKQLHVEVAANKQNISSISPSLTDIVPENVDISVIKSQNSKYVSQSNHKPLPFQIYHANKFNSQRNSQHSFLKNNTKSLSEQNSTQLPSIIKSQNPANNSYSGSVLEQTYLMGVQEIDDDQMAI